MKQVRLLILIFSFLPFCSHAQSFLDTSFNHTGVIKGQYGACEHLFLQSDNKIIACGYDIDGYYAIVRLDGNGSIDYNFANQGAFSLCYATDISFLNNDKILISTVTTNYYKPGWYSEDFTCFKLNEDWSLDTSFGNGGKVVTDIARWWHGLWREHDDDVTSSIALQSNGGVILYGSSGNDLAWARYTAEGQIDSSFGLYGISSYIYSGYLQETNDMAIMADGRIVSAFMGSDSLSMAVIRLLPDGGIDSTFGHNGIACYNSGMWLTYCKAMCLQPDGKVLLAGYSDSALVARFDTTGALDATFGNGGVCKLPPAAIRDMALAPDGKILLTGTRDSSFVVYRCLPNGVVDTTFGHHGMILTKIEPGAEDRAESIALQADGKILVGGSTETRLPNQQYPISEFVLARYLPDGHTGITTIPGAKGSLLVYPNPAKDKLLIRWRGESQPVPVTISLYDISGRRLWYQEHQTISNQPFTIDVSAFTAGVYLIRVSNNRGLNEERKFVKE